MIFVNLPLYYLAAHPEVLDTLAATGLAPELGFDAPSLECLSRQWHQDTAARLQGLGLGCGVHLPFFDLHPASADPLILAASRKRLDAAAQVARLYAPHHVVGHPGLGSALAPDTADALRQRCVATWRDFVDAWSDGPVLCLENIYDRSPDHLALLLAAIDHPRVGALLDIGHWHSFGRGRSADDLRTWLTRLGPWLRHLHLHDNSGAGDEHLGLGQGTIPFTALTELLEELGLRPSATLEPHGQEALDHCLAYLEAHPRLARALGRR